MSNSKTRTFQSLGKKSQHSIPGAYSRSGSAEDRTGSVSTSNVVFVGSSGGGEPQEVLWFGTFSEAKAVVRSGPILENLREYFDPGDDLVPDLVGFLRLEAATQAALTLQASAVDILVLTSVDYGKWNNQIYAQLANGVVSGTKVLSLKFGTDQEDTLETQKVSLQVQYTGAGTACTLTIDGTNVTTAAAGAPGDDLTLAVADYTTIQSLIDAFNTQGNYTAALITSDGEEASAELDYVTAVDIKTAVVDVKSDVQALIDAVNSQLTYATVALKAAAPRTMPDNITWTKMTGAVEPAPIAQDLTDAYTLLESENVQFIGQDGDDAADIAVLSTHITKMNDVNGRMERQGVVGGNTDLATTMALAKTTNNAAVNLAWGDFTNYNSNQVLTDFNAVQYAAKLLGQAASVPVNEPLTFKALKVVKLKTKLTTTQKNAAIKAGVIVPEVSPGGIARTVRSVTTSQKDDLKYNEFSMVREMLFFSRDLRQNNEALFVGKAGVNRALVSVRSVSEDRLDDYEKDSEIIIADPDDPQGNPAWKDFTYSIEGDFIRLRVTANLVAPINFIFQTHLFDILVSTVS